MALVSPLFVALFTAQLLWLSFYVIKQRLRSGTKLGDGGDARLTSAIAAHSNFTQFVPLMLIILIFCEVSTVGSVYCFVLGSAMFIGRVLHSYGLIVAEHRPTPTLRFRQAGMLLTFATLIIGAITLLVTHYA